MTRNAASQVPLHPLLSQRWSPRGFDTQHVVTDDTLTALLEAARWAPSANNTQPWRFLVTHRGDADFATLVELLAAGNQTWAQHSSALVLVAAETVDAAGAARSHALYDTGQAVAQLVAQAQAEGLSTHQMGGFDAAGAAVHFGFPAGLTPVVVVAIGQHDPAAALPEALAARETAPRTRLPLDELILNADAAARRVA
ncbi:nitroreductase family protein [Acidothermaceae bacterium B102]|nr:nitroreductase family protein [Acidothermaceae bacterium B102]